MAQSPDSRSKTGLLAKPGRPTAVVSDSLTFTTMPSPDRRKRDAKIGPDPGSSPQSPGVVAVTVVGRQSPTARGEPKDRDDGDSDGDAHAGGGRPGGKHVNPNVGPLPAAALGLVWANARPTHA
jgi:hypothetical protein